MINRLIKKSLPACRQGFTLIETLAAVLVLSIALAGPMTIAQKGISTALVSKDQNTAFNLAQDAIEYIRFARDTNCLAANGPIGCPGTGTPNWLNNTINLTPCVNVDTLGTTACTLDSYNNVVGSCTVGSCPLMYYDSTNNNYNQNSTGAATIFTRTVQILTYDGSCSGSCNQSEADITVTVSWSDPVAHSVVVNESLFDWQ